MPPCRRKFSTEELENVNDSLATAVLSTLINAEEELLAVLQQARTDRSCSSL